MPTPGKPHVASQAPSLTLSQHGQAEGRGVRALTLPISQKETVMET